MQRYDTSTIFRAEAQNVDKYKVINNKFVKTSYGLNAIYQYLI